MSYAETPAQTDAERILRALDDLKEELDMISQRQDSHVAAINSMGENITWLCNSLQGLFQMFQSPQMMAQFSSMMGGMLNGNGQQPAELGH